MLGSPLQPQILNPFFNPCNKQDVHCYQTHMIRVNDHISIDEREIEEHFVRASGPGGQHVNKVATAVQLRFNVTQSPSLPHWVKERLIRIAGSRISGEGVLIIDARRFRNQERNREDARLRLVRMIQKASKRSKARRKTKPTAASRERRLARKHHRSQIKNKRRPPGE